MKDEYVRMVVFAYEIGNRKLAGKEVRTVPHRVVYNRISNAVLKIEAVR